MARWRCIQFCGACCHLDPSDRPDLAEYLSAEELAEYLAMVGADGWCIYFDHSTRKCSIYDQRPQFCRVTVDNFQRMYGIPRHQFTEFANQCCMEQIAAVYGATSREWERFVICGSLA